jgi:hypothetical protein
MNERDDPYFVPSHAVNQSVVSNQQFSHAANSEFGNDSAALAEIAER